MSFKIPRRINLNHKWIMAIFFSVFFVLKLFYIFKYDYLIWDETVYISIGKYLISNGVMGYTEVIRPLILPIILGFFYKIGITSFFAYKIFILLASSGVALLTYIVAKNSFDKNTAIISFLLVLCSETFFIYSSYVLTGILGSLFMLLSIYFYQKNKTYLTLILTGFFAGLAYLTRFTYFYFSVALAFYIFIQIITSKTFQERKKHFLQGLFIGTIIIITITPFFIYNYNTYIEETKVWNYAMFRPMYYGLKDMSLKQVSWGEPIPYYLSNFFNNEPLFYFTLLGVLFSLNKLLKKDRLLLVMVLLLNLNIYMTYSVKDVRFMLASIPFLAIFSSYGLWRVYSWFSVKIFDIRVNKKNTSMFLIIILMLFSIIFISKIDFLTRNIDNPNIEEVFYFPDKTNMHGPLLTTVPQMGAYVNIPMDVAYYNVGRIHKFLLSGKYNSVLITNESIFCYGEEEQECNKNIKEIFNYLKTEYELVLNYTHNSVEYNYYSRENLKTQ